jgi:hypothetical protein
MPAIIGHSSNQFFSRALKLHTVLNQILSFKDDDKSEVESIASSASNALTDTETVTPSSSDNVSFPML